MKNKLIPIIIILILIGAGAYYFDRYYLKGNSSKVVEKASVDDIKTTKDTKDQNVKNTADSLIYLAGSEGTKEIISINAEGQNKKILYTDRDEALKIRSLSHVAYLSFEALAYVSADNSKSGKFYIIKLDQSGKKDEIDNIFEPSSISISPDGQQIAYVVFSNAEINYGNNILLVNRKGENRREIFHSDESISSLSFSPDSKSVAFVKSDNQGKSVISKVNIDSAKENQIFSASTPIPAISWSKDNKIIFTKSDTKYETGEIIEMDADGKNDKKIMETKNGLGVYAIFSGDGLNIAYIAVTFNGKFEKNAEGDIKVSSNLGQNINKIGSGSMILGWLP